MCKDSVSERVSRGVEKLTSHFGNQDWVDKIVADSIDVSDRKKCVLGQLFGDYGTGLQKLRLTTANSSAYSLDSLYRPTLGLVPDEDAAMKLGFTKCTMENWTPLGNEWRARVKKLQSERKPKKGDKVRVTYEAVWHAASGGQLAGYANIGHEYNASVPAGAKIEVIERHRKPEPGDRVRTKGGGVVKFGTVVKPKPGSSENQLWVLWDGQAYATWGSPTDYEAATTKSFSGNSW